MLRKWGTSLTYGVSFDTYFEVVFVNLDEHKSAEEPVMDENAALSALDGSRELLSELAEIFAEDVATALDQLEQAVESSDAASARRAAHSIKGLASTFFAVPTVEIARRLEQEAAAGELQSISSGGIAQLRQSIHELVTELGRHGLLQDRNGDS